MLSLAYGFQFSDFYARDGLVALDARFTDTLEREDAELFNRLMAARAQPDALTQKDESELILALALPLERFIAALFQIEGEAQALSNAHAALEPIYACKRLFVQRRAVKACPEAEVQSWNEAELSAALAQFLGAWDELSFARAVMGWLDAPEAHAAALEVAQRYAAWAALTREGQEKHKAGRLFKIPKKLDPARLIPVETELRHGVRMLKLSESHWRARDGFALTDPRGSLEHALDEAHYCIYCAHQGRDSCSKGFVEKTGGFRKNALGASLTGCPLEEKISEMNELKAQGYPIGALAAVVIDNPLCAGTGHRICNDCMKSCIYQKQSPVDIPLAETRTLDDVLALPYGFEIYSLLTRWNPLNIHRPLPRPATGRRVLIAGMGPAGYTLAHHLLNDGHIVVGIDGLKIEPLPASLAGEGFEPVERIASLRQPLETRAAAGFGGVAEYGITVRWDKNFLTILRLLLERRAQFRLLGGVRFGSQVTRESAWALGFDHIALCMGAGSPTLLDIPGGLARGVRTASDFLMGLQLTGAGRMDSVANLQLRLPVVVIGGGLTAVDTATEALAYYAVQVEKFLARFEILAATEGEAALRARWTPEEAEIAAEFLAHARALRAAENARERLTLLRGWGGATIAYRRSLTDAPSYRLNHEEVEKALEEGIDFAEGLTPLRIALDRYGHAAQAHFKDADGHELVLPARAVLMAAGTKPNTVLSREDAGQFPLDGGWFAATDREGNPITPERSPKPQRVEILTRIEPDGRAVSFFGDLHPSFAGNVVKAMASAKQGYPAVTHMLARLPARKGDAQAFLAHIASLLEARVHAVNRLTPTIVEVVLHAPLAAREFKPGQFYRLQNFEAHAGRVNGEWWTVDGKKDVPSPSTTHHSPSTGKTTLAMEGLALTGAWVDEARGLVALIVLEMGGSSSLCARLKPGEPVVLMGPTGSPSEIPRGETVLLAGGGLGNAVLFSIGRALRAAGCRVLYFAGYRSPEDRYKEADIEAAADVVVWCCDTALLAAARPQDKSFHGNIVAAMRAYAEGSLGAQPIPMPEVEHILAIGSDRMMAAVAAARHGELKPYLRQNHRALGSINSPMQCMMKEICAQCLQKHVDPATGKEVVVYSCFNQDQHLDDVSFSNLNERLSQNSLAEKITRSWLARSLNAEAQH